MLLLFLLLLLLQLLLLLLILWLLLLLLVLFLLMLMLLQLLLLLVFFCDLAIAEFFTLSFTPIFYRDYNLSCQPVDYSESPTALRAASALWGYYALKGLELLDSAFFALRGKYSHLTFLHVYHHSTMFCLW